MTPIRARLRALRNHPSIRLRLTLTYAVILVGTCAALLALNYALLYNTLYKDPNNLLTITDNPPGFTPKPVQDKPNTNDDRAIQDTKQALVNAAVARLRASTLVDTATTSAIALAATAVLGLGVSWIVAGRMLRPLHTLTAATRRISQDRLHERIALSGPRDELKELADTFDQMVARLEASFNSQRRFVADASHELRTPLAIVRTGAEVLLAKRHSTIAQWEAMAHRQLTATGRAERLLDGLLALARSDSGVIAQEPHDLAVAAAVALGDADSDAEHADLTVTTDLRPAPVDGDPILLDRLLTNLIDNAVRHNHQGGWIAVTTGRNDQHAIVTVRNSGDGVPPEEIDRLFQPFQRLAPDRTAGPRSTGLGLAIVRSIVHAHQGTVEAAPTPEGGLAVTVTLPARDAVPEDAEVGSAGS